MMRTVSLSDICTKITSGGTPLTKRDNYYGGGIPWLRTQEVNFGNIYSTEKTITELGLKNSSAKIIPKDSVIVAMYGATAGKSAINKIPLATNQACCNLIIDNSKADYRFVYYYLVNSYEKLLSAAVGAAQQNLGSKQISAMTINLPPLNQQKKIANILGSLDEKIELNRRMNETLEQLGQALFRHYFVDNPEAADWDIVSLTELCDRIASGGTPSTRNDNYYGGDIQWYSTKELKDNFVFCSEKTITGDGLNESSAKLFPVNTVMMAIYAAPTVGRLGILTQEAAFNQATCGLVAKPSVGYEFIYLYLLLSRSDLNNMANGAAQQNISVGKVRNFAVMKPDDQTILKFKEKIQPIFEKIKRNSEETITLTSMRDSLLPKLISGEIEE